MRRAASRAACTAGRSRAISTAMMAITTSSSIRVKPRRVVAFISASLGLIVGRKHIAELLDDPAYIIIGLGVGSAPVILRAYPGRAGVTLGAGLGSGTCRRTSGGLA